MRFGIWTPLPHTVRAEPRMDRAIAELTSGEGARPDSSYQFAIDVVRKAEDYGFDITLVAERFLGPDLECWTLATALATQTRHIQIMPAVHPGIILPQVAAKFGATLDRISGGRFVVNVVNGWWADEFNMYGNGTWLEDPAMRYRRMDEYMQVLNGLWTQDSYSIDGEFYQLRDGRLPTRGFRKPPVYAATRSEPGKEIIARHGDLWFISPTRPYDQFEDNLADTQAEIAAMNARAARHGRKVSYGISCHVICEPTDAAARRSAEELQEYGKKDRISAVAAKALSPGLVGNPQQIAERIERYRSIGVDCLLLHYHPMMHGLETFGEQVMPLLERGRPQTGLKVATA
jgi:FMNH2-dependent dimethyl sulfone monooxygenase